MPCKKTQTQEYTYINVHIKHFQDWQSSFLRNISLFRYWSHHKAGCMLWNSELCSVQGLCLEKITLTQSLSKVNPTVSNQITKVVVPHSLFSFPNWRVIAERPHGGLGLSKLLLFSNLINVAVIPLFSQATRVFTVHPCCCYICNALHSLPWLSFCQEVKNQKRTSGGMCANQKFMETEQEKWRDLHFPGKAEKNLGKSLSTVQIKL